MNRSGIGGKSWKSQAVFFWGCVFFFAVAGTLLVLKGKEDSFLLLNTWHHPWLDQFFIYYTIIGDGAFSAILGIFIFFIIRKRKLAVDLLIAWAATGILTQVIKRIVAAPRPMAYFSPKTFPFFINDVIHSGLNSFPSGHTVTAFAVATVLAVHTSSQWGKLLFLLAAILVGFSRIYLSQHFLSDVLGGAAFGITGAACCLWFTRKLKESNLNFTPNKNTD